MSVTGAVEFLDAPSTVLQYLGCNTVRSPLNDAALRTALWRGVDRENLADAYLSGHGMAAEFPISPACDLYPVELEEPYSRENFSAALASAWLPETSEEGPAEEAPDGAEELPPEPVLTLLVNEENGFKLAAAHQIARNLTEGGLPVAVEALPWEEFTAALAAGDFDLYYGETRLPADWDLRRLIGSGGALNYGGWADERTDELLAAFAVAEDRVTAAGELCAWLRSRAPVIPLCFKSTTVLTQAGVLEGLTPTMAEPFYNLGECTVHLKP